MLQNEASEQKIKDTVDKILSRREFQETGGENPITKIISQLWDNMKEWIQRILSQNSRLDREFQFRPDFFNSQFQAVLKILLVVMGVILLFALIRLVVKRVYLPRKLHQSHLPKVMDYLDNPDSAIQKMKALMEQKQYSFALRFLFVAVLLELNNRKIITLEKWKTNRVYIREIQACDPDMAEPMKNLSFLFNACCYGHGMVDASQMNQWLEFYHEIKEEQK